jgi:histidine phosphotransferase ChpT
MDQDAQERPLVLSEGVARRICHDFAGLLGSLQGLTALAGDDAEAAALAHETACRLSARVQLLRGAWGGSVDELDAAAICALAGGLVGGERLQVDCSALKRVLADAPARLCLCMLIVAAGALPRGGKIAVGSDPAGFWLSLEGRDASWPAILGAVTPPDAYGARELAILLCNMLARDMGWHMLVHGTRAVAGPA